jgi:hypothetical protein
VLRASRRAAFASNHRTSLAHNTTRGNECAARGRAGWPSQALGQPGRLNRTARQPLNGPRKRRNSAFNDERRLGLEGASQSMIPAMRDKPAHASRPALQHLIGNARPRHEDGAKHGKASACGVDALPNSPAWNEEGRTSGSDPSQPVHRPGRLFGDRSDECGIDGSASFLEEARRFRFRDQAARRRPGSCSQSFQQGGVLYRPERRRNTARPSGRTGSPSRLGWAVLTHSQEVRECFGYSLFTRGRWRPGRQA